jgi:hypothetical protein
VKSVSPLASLSPEDQSRTLAAGVRQARERRERPVEFSTLAGSPSRFAGEALANMGLSGGFGRQTREPQGQRYLQTWVDLSRNGPGRPQSEMIEEPGGTPGRLDDPEARA